MRPSFRSPIHALAVFTLLAGLWACGGDPREEALTNLIPQWPIEGSPTWTIEERMEAYGVPGVSVAVIEGFELAWAEGYGVTATGGEPVTADTLFQVGQLSQLVTVMTVLELVEEGLLSLDAPIGDYLTSWQLPETAAMGGAQAVTLRGLLSHTAGVNVAALLGYRSDDTLPTLEQILRGESPAANTAPVAVTLPPGNQIQYSAGGFLVVQKVLEDVSGRPFAELAREKVLDPLSLTRTTFEQPPTADLLASAATGHLNWGEPVEDKANRYPELAASGMWTTAPELARIAIEIQRAADERGDTLLSGENVSAMLSPTLEGSALGVFMSRPGEAVRFTSAGNTRGFHARLVAYPSLGHGAVVLTSSDTGFRLSLEVLRSLSIAYEWPNYLPPWTEPASIDAGELELLAGRFAVDADGLLELTAAEGYLASDEVLALFAPLSSRLYPAGDGLFIDQETGRRVAFRLDRDGRATAYTFQGLDGSEVIYSALPQGQKQPVELLVEGEVEKAIEAYRQLGTQVSELRINQVGYELLNQNEPQAAVAVFELNTELYPGSANTWDSLADALMVLGDEERAVEAFRHVLELLPDDETTNELLREQLAPKARYFLDRLGAPAVDEAAGADG